MLQQKNVTHLTIVNGAGAMVADGTLVNDYTDFTSDGDIAILDVDNIAHDHTSTGAHDKFRIAQRHGTQVLYSPFITSANIKNFRGTAAVAATEQIDYIGYNGTTGSIDEIDDNVYKVNLDVRLSYAAITPRQMLKFGVYKSGSSATQADIAAGLTQNLIDNFSREKRFGNEESIKFERINSGTSTATSGGALTVITGSKTVTIVESAGGANDAGKYNADAGTMVVGDYIRFGHATTTTYPVYKIASITGAGTGTCTVTLDVPYQGVSGSVAAANAGVIPVASVADFGIMLTGRPRTNFKAGVFRYMKARWTTTLVEDFGATLLTNAQAATEGTGVGYQIAEDEWFYQGNEGAYYRVMVPPFTPRALAVTSNYYYQITLEDVDKSYSTLAGTPELPKKEVLAIAVTSIADQTAHDNFETALETITGLTMV